MTMKDEKSLGDDWTLAGATKRRPASEASLGDERTLGDNRSGQDTVIDDIEVVDLELRYKVEGTLGQGGMGAVTCPPSTAPHPERIWERRQGRPATATLTALTKGRRRAWSRQSLASLFRRAPSLEVAFHAIVTRDLAVKLESVR